MWGLLTSGWKLHFQTTNYGQVGLDQCLRRKDIKGFGNFVHIGQDSFSHKGINPIEHIFLGHSPDQYSEMNPRDQKMKEFTIWWLQEFKRVNQPVFKRR
jgi:hypothetical protein